MASGDIEQISNTKRINVPVITSFNSMPTEIFIKIFCNVDCNQLYQLEYVCKRWWKIINEIGKIQRIEISNERWSDAVYVFRKWWLARSFKRFQYSFDVYQTPYVLRNAVCDTTMFMVTKDFRGTIYPLDYEDFIENLFYVARTVSRSSELARRFSWMCLLSIVGLTEQYSIKDLSKNYDLYSKLPAMEEYEWYYNGDHKGISVLYPDKKTFAVSVFPFIDITDQDDAEACFTSDGSWASDWDMWSSENEFD